MDMKMKMKMFFLLFMKDVKDSTFIYFLHLFFGNFFTNSWPFAILKKINVFPSLTYIKVEIYIISV